MEIWDLPRPASFVDAIEFSIRDGSNVITRFPVRVPIGFERALRERLHSVFEWSSVDASCSGLDPVSVLRQQICPNVSALRASTMTKLAETRSFQVRLVWIENIQRTVWSKWADALVAYSDACRNVDLVSRTVLVVVVSGDTVAEESPDGVALVRRDFRDVVDALELFIFALCRLPSTIRDREYRALLAQAVSQIARWDCFLAERLLSLSAEEKLVPEGALVEYASCRGWTSETSRRWESGTVDGPVDRPVVHSALLAVSGERRIVRQRIWAAQATVLLPLVEDRRVSLIRRSLRYLKPLFETGPPQGSSFDPYELEVGDLVWRLDGTDAPQVVKRQAQWLRDVRNKLAHMQPLDPGRLLDWMLRSDP